LSAVFCGNPQSHDAHEGTKGYCEGVHRNEVKEEVIVEKWEAGRLEPDIPGGSKNIDYVRGQEDAAARKKYEVPSVLEVRTPAHYRQGYDDQLERDFLANKLTVNQVRELKGFEPFSYPLPDGEVRTTSSTGGMKGVKPERYSLIPVEALDIMARLYGFGAEKYEAHNWRKGYEWTKSFDSLFRHATSALRGEDLDPETGLPHLAGVVFHCFTLMVFAEEHPEFDDRWTPDGRNTFNEAVKKERLRQIHELGYSPEHDDNHGVDRLLTLAQKYFGKGETVKGSALIVAAQDVILRSAMRRTEE